jgi:hypothetical protein
MVWPASGAEATKGQTSNSYMPAFTRIAPYIAQYGPRKYSVRTALWKTQCSLPQLHSCCCCCCCCCRCCCFPASAVEK